MRSHLSIRRSVEGEGEGGGEGEGEGEGEGQGAAMEEPRVHRPHQPPAVLTNHLPSSPTAYRPHQPPTVLTNHWHHVPNNPTQVDLNNCLKKCQVVDTHQTVEVR